MLVGKVLWSLGKDSHIENKKKKGKVLQGILAVMYARSQRCLGLGLGLQLGLKKPTKSRAPGTLQLQKACQGEHGTATTLLPPHLTPWHHPCGGNLRKKLLFLLSLGLGSRFTLEMCSFDVLRHYCKRMWCGSHQVLNIAVSLTRNSSLVFFILNRFLHIRTPQWHDLLFAPWTVFWLSLY